MGQTKSQAGVLAGARRRQCRRLAKVELNTFGFRAKAGGSAATLRCKSSGRRSFVAAAVAAWTVRGE
jgi:hypothetical protein